MYVAQRDYALARAELARAQPAGGLPTALDRYLKANICIAQGNVAQAAQDIVAAGEWYGDALDHATAAGTVEIAANAAFNLGTVFSVQDRLGDAKETFERARYLYASLGRPDKVAESNHQLGNVAILAQQYSEALCMYEVASTYFRSSGDSYNSWRVVDDSARAATGWAREAADAAERDDRLRIAFEFARLAQYFSDRVWEAHLTTPERLPRLSQELSSSSATYCEIALMLGDVDDALAELVRSKGRMRAFTVPVDLGALSSADADPDRAAAMRAPRALLRKLQLALEQLRGDQRLAFVEHVLLPEGFMGCFVMVPSPESAWPGGFFVDQSIPHSEPDGFRRHIPSTSRLLRIAPVLDHFMREMQQQIARCSAPPDREGPGFRERLLLDAGRFAEASIGLGRLLFPSDLLDELRRHDIQHVVLVTEPLLPPLPYQALKTDYGIVLEQGWSLSVASSSAELITLADRWCERARTGRRLTWMCADDDVFTRLGGQQEMTHVTTRFDAQAIRGDAASLPAVLAALDRGDWVHVRGHGDRSALAETSGVVMAHGDVLSMTALNRVRPSSAGYLVTSACSTGFAEGVGMETIGSMVNYDQFGMLGSILTLWDVDGLATTRFMVALYDRLAEGDHIGTAVRAACLSVRTELPHPYYWAAFSLTGGWGRISLPSWVDDGP